MAVRTASDKILAVVEAIGRVKEGQYGQYQSILISRYDVQGEDGKFWKSLKSSDAAKIRKGQQLWLIPTTRDGKETFDIELIDDALPAPQRQQSSDSFTLDNERKRQIAAYLDQAGDLLAFCRKTAAQKLEDAPEEAIQAATATLFIAAQRKFNL